MISSKTKSSMFVPEVVIQRIPIYLRILQEELNFGNNVISSKNLGNRLQMSSAQIRKDLSYFGKFGKQGQGYPIAFLVDKLKVVVGLEQNLSLIHI